MRFCYRLFSSFFASRRHFSHAILSLGGNIGNVESAFTYGMNCLRRNGVQVLGTSNLYLTPAMHITDQPDFLNAALWVKSTYSAEELLRVIKQIEVEAGRDMLAKRWGPRALDIDIVFMDDQKTFRTTKLEVPHPRWQDRAFVCLPVSDLITGDEAQSEWSGRCTDVKHAICHLPQADIKSIKRVWPMNAAYNHIIGSRTLVMGILNVTRDSFSDGGLNVLPDEAVNSAKAMIAEGADIIDIGGQSTRPGARLVSAAEELERVGPVIERLSLLSNVTISVDTFYADVAREAVARGAHVVNDVTGGRADPGMLRTVAELGVSLVAMHSRGRPGTFHEEQFRRYEDLEGEVASELTQAARAAMDNGIPAWRIMLDTGIGFSKSKDDSLRLVTSLPIVRSNLEAPFSGAPQLVGLSRKSFIGNITGQKIANRRDDASTAAHALAIAAGADVIRVHNVPAAVDACRLVDAALRCSPIANPMCFKPC